MSEPKITPQDQIHYSRVRWKRTWQHLIKNENGEWQIRLDREIEGYDSLLQKWVTLRTETTFEPLDKHGLVKEVHFNVLFARTTTDRNSLLDLRAFFVQAMKCTIPDIKAFKDVYLNLENQNLYVSELQVSTMAISLSFSEENRFAEWLEKIGEPKRLTDKQASELLRKSDTIGIFEEDRDGNFTTRSLGTVRVNARG
jgi:hypothetical protein